MNHRISTITAQIHDDSWYADSNGQVTSASGGRRQGSAGVGVPRPLPGNVLDDRGDIQFGVEESVTTASDGSVQTNLRVGFVAPAVAAASGPGIPLLSLAATVSGRADRCTAARRFIMRWLRWTNRGTRVYSRSSCARSP